MTVSELLTKIADVRELARPLQEKLNGYEQEEALLRIELQKALEAEGLKSAKGDRLAVTTSVRRDYKVVDEVTVRGYLQNHGLLEEFTRLDLTAVKKLAKQDVVPGLELTETTILSIKGLNEVQPEVDDSKEALQRAKASRGDFVHNE